MSYTKCAECGKFIDIKIEAITHKNKKDYCLDCYEDLIADEQNDEYTDMYNNPITKDSHRI